MMKRWIARLLCCILAVTAMGTTAFGSDGEAGSAGGSAKIGSASEEDAIAALAYTTADVELTEAIQRDRVIVDNVFVRHRFGSEEFSEYTNDAFGGLYFNDDGAMVFCFTEGSEALAFYTSELQTKAFEKGLISESEGVITTSVVIKAVENSYSALQNVQDFLNKQVQAGTFLSMREWGVDTPNNQVSIITIDDTQTEAIERAVLPFGKSIIEIEVDPNRKDPVEVVAITGTSAIHNGSIASTPAGRIYIAGMGYGAVVTCAHGWAIGDNVLTGNTLIGSVIDRVYSGNNDSSLIILNSGHSYTGAQLDEISSDLPSIGDTVTMRGYVSGRVRAEVLSTNKSYLTSNFEFFYDLIQTDVAMQHGDSGGGAISKYIDAGRTAVIVGINKSVLYNYTYLVRGDTIIDAYT